MLSPLNTAFLKISRRAETYDRAQLVATFVDIGALFTLLSNRDHQVLYGRRGTGKTHALYYLADSVEAKGDLSVQLPGNDYRSIRRAILNLDRFNQATGASSPPA